MSGKYVKERTKRAVEDLETIGLSPVVCFPTGSKRHDRWPQRHPDPSVASHAFKTPAGDLLLGVKVELIFPTVNWVAHAPWPDLAECT